MKRFLIFILAVLLLSGCAAAPDVYVPTGNGLTLEENTPIAPTENSAPVQEQELVMVYYPKVTLNPYLCKDFTNRTLFSLLYQGLFAVDSDYNVSPVLCSRYTMSDSMRRYTFYVEQATFPDGSVLTIQDVFASMQAARITLLS